MLHNRSSRLTISGYFRLLVAPILPLLYIMLCVFYLLYTPLPGISNLEILLVGLFISIIGGYLLITFSRWYYVFPILICYIISIGLFIILAVGFLVILACIWGGTCL